MNIISTNLKIVMMLMKIISNNLIIDMKLMNMVDKEMYSPFPLKEWPRSSQELLRYNP